MVNLWKDVKLDKRDFFSVYKELEGKETKVLEWHGAGAARQAVTRALKQYKKKFG